MPNETRERSGAGVPAESRAIVGWRGCDLGVKYKSTCTRQPRRSCDQRRLNPRAGHREGRLLVPQVLATTFA